MLPFRHLNPTIYSVLFKRLPKKTSLGYIVSRKRIPCWTFCHPFRSISGQVPPLRLLKRSIKTLLQRCSPLQLSTFGQDRPLLLWIYTNWCFLSFTN
jgi:hypothetical protein